MCRFHLRAFAYVLGVACLMFCFSAAATGQTSTFTYQGRLTDGGTPANGAYDLEFTVWDALTSGNQIPIGSPITLTKSSVSVTNGVFTVHLDFTTAAFPGADRYLEVSVKHP